MKIAVLFKAVPDLVEDIALDEESGEILYDDMSYVPSEWDDQALEEAMLIKEESGGEVTAITVDTGDSDNMLYTALAKGADHAVKLVGDFDPSLSNRSRAQIFSEYIRQHDFDLVLSGVQAIDDIDGQIPGLVAGILGWPHASVVTEVHVTGNTVILRQEYAGGVVAEIQTPTPVVIGIQAARKPPRYASIAKVRQVAKSTQIEEVEMAMPTVPQLEIRRFYKPVAAGHAEMIDGDVDEVAARIIEILQERNLVRR
ncbi:electron transfer flavoprotein subunit beta/FixA family protein [Sulfobacillus thermosulfidooxidans]|uniref:electron transfer flavoprotein subunit beta/FixA family protein n=1 Tax=Sulfobacillus thermosulfidooxidans TaxID=28034 RepID=UPI0003F9D81D|nr:electron transfer flavoprotein subunit beta [Sulfobacillus thermosulfidooxidans]